MKRKWLNINCKQSFAQLFQFDFFILTCESNFQKRMKSESGSILINDCLFKIFAVRAISTHHICKICNFLIKLESSLHKKLLLVFLTEHIHLQPTDLSNDENTSVPFFSHFFELVFQWLFIWNMNDIYQLTSNHLEQSWNDTQCLTKSI